ncbi:MAG TPA: hypothetical protein DC042_04955 [Bacteroidales bacterium]|nr:hypothetical protein [Bacteroidales bacterium]
MKKFYKTTNLILVMVLTLFLLTGIPTVGQTKPKVPCLEHFTASTCPPCSAFNPVFAGYLSGFAGKYTIIRYQMYWPGTGDPYYFAESRKRRDYYTVTGVPGLICNGAKQLPYAQSFSVARMEELLTLYTGMEIGITASVNADKIVTATITITPEIGYEAGLVTQIVVMEGVTTQNVGTNGEVAFDHVAMGFMPNANGTVLAELVPGQPVTLTYTLDMKTTHNETANDLIVAAFVQNNTTKEVVQSKMENVTHPFVDYQANFEVFDNDYNPVPGGKVFLTYYGEKIIDQNGAVQFNGVFPGTFVYRADASGYYGTEGEITVGNGPYKGEVLIEKPDLFFYQDFNNNAVPEGWSAVKTNGFYLEGSGTGTLVFYKPNDGDDESYLILPPVNMNQSGIFSFRAGNQAGNPVAKIGIVTTEPVPGTDGTSGIQVTGFTELYSATINMMTGFRVFGFPIPETVGNQLLAIKYLGPTLSYFELDQIAILEDNPGMKVQFLVTDQDDKPLANTVVTLQGKTIANNTHGYASFRDTDPGSYTYIVTYKNEQIETGILTVEGEMVKHIRHNTSSVEDPAKIVTFTAFPNPTNGKFVVSGITSGTLTVMNLNGQTVLNRPVVNGNTIDLTGLAEGTFLIRFTDGNSSKYQKILIRK